MPELRSSTRQARLRSKKPEDPQPGEQPVKPASPAPQRAGKRAPTRAARGRKVAAGRRAPPAPKPKRNGVEIVDLEADPACEDPLKAVAGLEVAGAAKNLALNKVAEVGINKGLKMEGESGEKIVGAEDELTATPVPERVLLALLHFMSIYCHLPSSSPTFLSVCSSPNYINKLFFKLLLDCHLLC
jgi:hypothetical protein